MLLWGVSVVGVCPESASAQPVNDNCGSATPVGGGTFPFTLVGATNDAEGSCGATETAPDVWFAYTAAATGAARVETCGLAAFDTVLALFASCGGPELDCNDDACGTLSAIDFAASAGTTYFVRVAGFNGAVGAGMVRLTLTPSEPLNANGLPHVALGQAILSYDAVQRRLTIGNIGSSGQEGARVQVGDVLGFATAATMNPQATPIGATMVTRSIGTVNGTPNSRAGFLGLTRVPGGYTAQPDFSDLGSPNYTVTVYNDDVAVLRRPGLASDAVGIMQSQPTRWHCHYHLLRFNWSFGESLTINVPGESVVGDRVLFEPDVPSTVPIEITHVDLLGANMPEIRIEGEAVFTSGLEHEGRGNALLSGQAGGSVLQVANIGSSGRDGVTAQVAFAEGMLWTVAVQDNPAPVGSFVVGQSRGPVNGTPDQPGGELRLERIAAGYCLTPDFSSLGVAGYTTNLYRNGSLVYQQSGMTGPAVQFAAAAGSGGNRFCCRGARYSFNFGSTGRNPIDVSVVNGPTVLADEVIFEHDPSPLHLDFLASISTTASGISAFSIRGEQPLLFGLIPHASLDTGILESAPGRLTVSHLGSGGTDGVAVDIGHFQPAVAWTSIIAPIAAPLFPTGTYLVATTNGSLNGVPGQTLLTTRVEDVGSTLEVTFDFSLLGPNSYTAEARLQGVVVDTVTNVIGAAGTIVNGGCIIDPVGRPPCPPECIAIAARFGSPTPTVVTLTGRGPVMADEIYAYPAPGVPVADVDSFSDFTLVAAGLPQITITSLSVMPAIECPCEWNHDGILNSQDFFDFLNVLFAGDADFNGDDITNSQDFFDFLNCFFQPPVDCP